VAILRNAHTLEVIATRVERTHTALERTIGLLARPIVRRDEGVWIDHCRAIHTVGMRATIDVIFVDREGVIVRIYPGIQPFNFGLICSEATAVIELGTGAVEDHDLLRGDRLELS
jgi:hypothetical protein